MAVTEDHNLKKLEGAHNCQSRNLKVKVQTKILLDQVIVTYKPFNFQRGNYV